MRTTDGMHEVLERPIPKVPTLRGTSVTILFYEASTRTRVSFEVAAKNLSADVVNVAASTSSVSKGESLVDTVRTIEALGADMLVIRHPASGAPYLAAEVFGGSVLNGGDGWHAHPSQALLDLYTLRSRLPGGSVEGRKVVILGDVLHSRVARSNIWTLTAMGADLWLCGPSTLLRGFEAWAARGAAGRRFTVTSDVAAALTGRGRRHGAADPAGADGGGPAAVAARVRGPLRADPRAAARRVARRRRHAPGADERGRRDRRGRRRRPAVGDHGPRSPTASRCAWRSCTCWPARGQSRSREPAGHGRGRRGGRRRRRRDAARLGRGPVVGAGGCGRGRRPGRAARRRGDAGSRASDADGLGAGRRADRARVPRPPRAPPRARQRGRRDGGHGPRRRGARRVHHGLPDAQHHARHRRPVRGRADPVAPPRPPGRRCGC